MHCTSSWLSHSLKVMLAKEACRLPHTCWFCACETITPGTAAALRVVGAQRHLCRSEADRPGGQGQPHGIVADHSSRNRKRTLRKEADTRSLRCVQTNVQNENKLVCPLVLILDTFTLLLRKVERKINLMASHLMASAM